MFVKRKFVTWKLQWRKKGSLKLSHWILLIFVSKILYYIASGHQLCGIYYIYPLLSLNINPFCAIMLSFYTSYFIQFPSFIVVAALSCDYKNLILQRWNIESNKKIKEQKKRWECPVALNNILGRGFCTWKQ